MRGREKEEQREDYFAAVRAGIDRGYDVKTLL